VRAGAITTSAVLISVVLTSTRYCQLLDPDLGPLLVLGK